MNRSKSMMSAFDAALRAALNREQPLLASGRAVSKAALIRLRHKPETINGTTIDPTKPGVTIPILARMLMGSYETPEIRLVRRHLPENVDVIELGAGIGFVSGAIANTVSDQVDHIAVEANPYLLPTLAAHTKLNDDSFVPYFGAYAPGKSQVYFDIQRKFDASQRADTGNGQSLVPAVDIRKLKKEFGINDFCIVADIEGAETELLAEGELEGCNSIILETHSYTDEDSTKQLLDILGEQFDLVGKSDVTCAFVRN